MDWTNWKPVERANLCFVVKDNQVLLIHKKRGLGAGKISAPGGKIEPGETALESAIRETREEVGVVPIAPEFFGELLFQFADGYGLHCSVFRSLDCLGNPVETVEAKPFWCDLDSIPYSDMWADDMHWVPLMLAGQKFRGFFTFDSDVMLSHRVDLLDTLSLGAGEPAFSQP